VRRRPNRALAATARGHPVGSGETAVLLRDPNFRPYLVGNMLSTTGTRFQTLAQAILVYRLTHSTFLLGVVGFASYAAVFALAPITGRVADRYDRRTVLVATQLVSTAITGTLCAVTARGSATPGLVIGFAFLLGSANAFATPSLMALAPTLVQPAFLSTALALNSATFNIGRAIGPVLAAVVIGAFGPAWAFGINAFSYLALVAGVCSVHPLIVHKRPDVATRLIDSLRIVLRDRKLVALLYTIMAMNLATDPPITLGPAFMSREYHDATSLAGLLVGAFGLGAVLAAFTIAPRLRGTRVTIMSTLLVTGLGVAAFAVLPSLELGLAGLAVMGFGYLLSNTVATSRLQLDVPPEHRGRIMVLWSLAFLGARPLGSLVDGSLASWAGVRVAAFAMAVPAFAGSAVFFGSGLRARRARPELDAEARAG